MKGTFHKSIAVPAMLMVILITYFGAVCLLNFAAVPGWYDGDMYSDLMYSVEVWEHKSIFPEGWVFGNQLNAVSTPVLAALFYGILGNPNTAMALASSLMTLLVLISFDWMVKPILKTPEARLLSAVMMMAIPLFYGDAVYSNTGWTLLYTMCSYYAGYSITIFLAFGCYLRGDRVLSGSRKWLLALTCLLSFGTGIQSIRQTVIMVLPMIGMECLRVICSFWKRPLRKGPGFVTALVAASNVAGLIFVRLLDINKNEIFGKIEITPFSGYGEAIRKCFLMVLSLLSNSNVESHLLLGALFLICGITAILILYQGYSAQEADTFVLMALIAMSVLVIVAIDIFTTMYVRPRYYFMLYPLISFLVAYGFSFCKKPGRISILALVILLFCLSCQRELANVCGNALNQESETSYEISDYLQENGYTTVYSVWGHGGDIAVASQGKIRMGFWHYTEHPFEPVSYLCDIGVFSVENEASAYLFDGKEAAEFGEKAAKELGEELRLIKHFQDRDVYLYTASANLMKLLMK